MPDPPSDRSPGSAGAAEGEPGGAGTAKGETTVLEPTRAERTLARRVAESKATVPEVSQSVTADLHDAVELASRLAEAAGEGEPAPSLADMVVRAVALALREHPRANGSYRDGRFELHGRVNVGVTLASAGGAVVPTIFDADRKDLARIAAETRALVERGRNGALSAPEVAGATFTIADLGAYGIDRAGAIIVPPQAGVLAVGAAAPRPAVADGELTARTTAELTLVSDHRILHGAEAAAFLAAIRRRLQAPAELAGSAA